MGFFSNVFKYDNGESYSYKPNSFAFGDHDLDNNVEESFYNKVEEKNILSNFADRAIDYINSHYARALTIDDSSNTLIFSNLVQQDSILLEIALLLPVTGLRTDTLINTFYTNKINQLSPTFLGLHNKGLIWKIYREIEKTIDKNKLSETHKSLDNEISNKLFNRNDKDLIKNSILLDYINLVEKRVTHRDHGNLNISQEQIYNEMSTQFYKIINFIKVMFIHSVGSVISNDIGIQNEISERDITTTLNKFVISYGTSSHSTKMNEASSSATRLMFVFYIQKDINNYKKIGGLSKLIINLAKHLQIAYISSQPKIFMKSN